MSEAAKLLASLILPLGSTTQEAAANQIGATVERARQLLDELVDFGILRRRGRQFHYHGR